MFDESGSVVMFGKKAALRRGPTPCETHTGCLKGHHKNIPDLNPQQSAIIRKYRASKASGGVTLSAADRDDEFLGEMFASLMVTDELIARRDQQSLLNTIVTAAATRR